MMVSPDFDSIKQVNILDREYWSARDLMPLLGYQYWQNFDKIIKKAMISANEIGLTTDDHFSGVTKMVSIGSGAQRKTKDYFLSKRKHQSAKTRRFAASRQYPQARRRETPSDTQETQEYPVRSAKKPL